MDDNQGSTVQDGARLHIDTLLDAMFAVSVSARYRQRVYATTTVRGADRLAGMRHACTYRPDGSTHWTGTDDEGRAWEIDSIMYAPKSAERKG